MNGDDPVLLERDGKVAVVRINRPARRNALRGKDVDLLTATLREVGADPGARAVVLGGTGGWLCAGGDLAEDVADGPAAAERMVTQFQTLLRAVLDLRLPVVSVVEGAAAGAGAALALAADVSIADPGSKIILPWITRGLVPDMGVAFLVARQIGAVRAKQLLYRGESLGAAEAHEHGLLTAVSPDPWPVAMDEAARLALAPPFALAATKRLVNAAAYGALDAYLDLERASMAAAMGTPEPHEGMAAFAERRAPVYE